jgi:hypothetical protein
MATLRRLLHAALALVAFAPAAQASEVQTPTVFRKFGGRVVKVRVVELGSSAKAAVGTGFFVSAGGLVVTNYHVVSDVVLEPARYKPEIVLTSGESTEARILSVDVVHDLAVLATGLARADYFTLAPVAVEQGDRLDSLGPPHDLGRSIVEGTFNGYLEHTLYPKIHFTGAINAGMSGGPTIDLAGRVVGVNVASAGNAVGFLVPVERAIAMVAAVTAPTTRPAELVAALTAQITAFQDAYVNDILAAPRQGVAMGPFTAPTQPAAFFRCWGDTEHSLRTPYEIVHHRCSTDDYLYIAGDHWSGVVTLGHERVSSNKLFSLRFFRLYSQEFSDYDETDYGGNEDNVTRWQCGARNLTNGSAGLRTELCVRRYKKLKGLYDAVLRTAVLGARSEGLVSTLSMSGLTYANIERLSRYLLEGVRWR